MLVTGYDIPVCVAVVETHRLRSIIPHFDYPDYAHQVGPNVLLAPPEPLLHKCPETEYGCAGRRLTYLRSFTEQWGRAVTRHDVYRCGKCRTKWVSTNGRPPEVATDDL